MEQKLKTLKDIFKSGDREFKEASYNCSCGACDEGCFGSCAVVQIKQEAIRWAKEIKDKDKTLDILTFIAFFNLTEEDLK